MDKRIQEIRNENIGVDFENDPDLTINDVCGKQLDEIEEDLEILAIIKECLIFRPSYYHNQADYSAECITMCWLDKSWTPPEIYEKVRKWCFKNKVKGTEDYEEYSL